ncbi:50S ribosomal protein L14e [Candidatus Woesearchaeota archaeon]|nr:50S ribosomal protein L14e [Candidatus Woesearchaeota archaeon]
MIFEVGRVCVKLAGRDAGQRCVVVDLLEDNYVLIDGLTRRRKCNVHHLEPLGEVIKLKKGASHSDVSKEFKKLGIDIPKKVKAKKAGERPKKVRKVKVKPAKEEVKKKKPKKESIIATAKKELEKKVASVTAPKEEVKKKVSPKKKTSKK